MTTFSELYFKPGPGEQVETAVHMQEDNRSAISGVVLDKNDKPVADAMLLLYKTGGPGEQSAIARVFTEKNGEFAFGPLTAGELYRIKVYKNSIKLRELEIRAD